MPDPIADRRTPALPTGGVPTGALSPAELTDLLAVSSGAEVRAAFACGMASALLPVLAIAAQEPELGRMDRMAYLTGAGLLALGLLSGLATFLDAVALAIAGLLRRIGDLTWRPLGRGAALAVATLVRRSGGAGSAADRRRTAGNRLPLARIVGGGDEGAALSQRERRALAKTVAAHCAATLAVSGAFVACAAWVTR